MDQTAANEIVTQVIQSLETLRIPYLVVGSYSSNAFGIARATQDADFIVELGNHPITAVGALLGSDIHIDPQMSFETITMTPRYVATHRATGFKVEFFLLTDEPFHRLRFARRIKKKFGSIEMWVQSPEDVVIQKLRWHGLNKARGKDIDDARNVLAVSGDTLDYDYIRKWCDEFGAREAFEQLKREAEQLRE